MSAFLRIVIVEKWWTEAIWVRWFIAIVWILFGEKSLLYFELKLAHYILPFTKNKFVQINWTNLYEIKQEGLLLPIHSIFEYNDLLNVFLQTH